MIRLTYRSGGGGVAGTTFSSEKHWIRVGTSGDCEIHFDSATAPDIAPYHAGIVLKAGAYNLIDLDSPSGTWLNGEKVTRSQLRSGDRIRFGGDNGVEAEVEVVIDAGYDAAKDAAEIEKVLSESKQTSAGQIFRSMAAHIADDRLKAGGVRSNKTIAHLANAVRDVAQSVKRRTRSRWVKIVGVVALVALVVIAVLGGVILQQQRRIADLLDTKSRFDVQINKIQARMQTESDPAELVFLERELLDATAQAQRALNDLAQTSKPQADSAANTGDDLDKDIRVILRQFGAETYAVPPIFKQRLKFHIARLQADRSITREAYERKVKYWPAISYEFRYLELPDAMGYIAWAESNFTPTAKSKAGAVGMWQMMAVTARQYGLRVTRRVDERTDPVKQTRAAARHLANLLSEFGEDEFMLAVASYNRGENGVRAVLHRLAQTPGGWKRDKRDFWHLYRLRLLPPETREYVPRVIAAAIVSANPVRYGIIDSTATADSTH